jgi:hypothetical protein
MQWYQWCNVVDEISITSYTFPYIVNVHKSVEVQMEDENAACPNKFTDLCQEITSLTIQGIDPVLDQHRAYVFNAIIPILGGYKGFGATVTYRSNNSFAHELIAKMKRGIVPWLFHF